MIKSILVALDGSEHADAAAEYALWLGQRLRATLIGLHVVDIVSIEGSFLHDISGSLGFEPYLDFSAKMREALRRGAVSSHGAAAAAIEVEAPAAPAPIEREELHPSGDPAARTGLSRKLAKRPSRDLFRPMLINGLPGYVSYERDDIFQTTAFAIEDGKITEIYITRNPDKLRRVAQALNISGEGDTRH